MITLFTGTLLISLIHGLIPSHWIPVLALKEKFAWASRQNCPCGNVGGTGTFIKHIFIGDIARFIQFVIGDCGWSGGKGIGIDEAYGGLLPDGKVDKVENLKKKDGD